MFLCFLHIGRNGDSHLAEARLQVLDWDLFLSWQQPVLSSLWMLSSGSEALVASSRSQGVTTDIRGALES